MINTTNSSFDNYLCELPLPPEMATGSEAQRAVDLSKMAVDTVERGLERGMWISTVVVGGKVQVIDLPKSKRGVH